eukprot:scpid9150/ scgid15316/ ABC transporter G family member 19; White-brown complex homolog protein 19
MLPPCLLVLAVTLGLHVGTATSLEPPGTFMEHVVLDQGAVQRSYAFCNDYSPAHYYVDSPLVDDLHGALPFSRKTWIVFLEGGGVCQNPAHCSSRYFSSSRRLMTSSNSGPLMSMPWWWPFKLEGWTILSRHQDVNPVFHKASRLVMPYCSSDLWLGRSKTNILTSVKFKYLSGLPGHNRSTYSVLGSLMAFRGVAIFRTIFAEAWRKHGMRKARRILLAGSSAGGIGALNQVEWVVNFIAKNTDSNNEIQVSVLSDSSWFVDFRGVLSSRIHPLWVQSYLRVPANDNGRPGGNATDRPPSVQAMSSLDSPNNLPVNFCSQPDGGYPCCLSLQCVVRSRHQLGFVKQPFMIVSSRFDAYLPSVAAQEALAVITERSLRYLQAARLAVEFGGVQILSLMQRHMDSGFQSSYIPACTQHVYLATSNLWAGDGLLGAIMASVFGGNSKGQVFVHDIGKDLWNTICIPDLTPECQPEPAENTSAGTCEADSTGTCANARKCITLRESIMIWWLETAPDAAYPNTRTLAIDTCEGISCNPTCPDSVHLGSVRNDWTTDVDLNVLIAIITYSLAIIAIFVKHRMFICRVQIQDHIDFAKHHQSKKISFPPLAACDAVTVACTSIHYTVKLREPATDLARRTSHRQSSQSSRTAGCRDQHSVNTTPRPSDAQMPLQQPDDEFVPALVMLPTGGGNRPLPLEQIPERCPSARSSERGSILRRQSRVEEYEGNGESSKNLRKLSTVSSIKKVTIKDDVMEVPASNTGTTRATFCGTLTATWNKRRPEWFEERQSRTAKVDTRSISSQRRRDTPTSRMRSSASTAELGLEEMGPHPALPLADNEKRLLSQVSTIFRPGELIAIMGPSGCGKSTLLELLAGRRDFAASDHHVEGNIFAGGKSLRHSSVLKSYIADAGYVRQLATPYYEELTVRENLVLASFQRLPSDETITYRVMRVEGIISLIGLDNFADTAVGSSTGPGLSGGQKRRLCIGLQLIHLPKVLFLDEPTSGLDSTSTMEILEVLANIATSGRLVILSIHQPRTEVVHMFNNILFLHDGKVMFYDSPVVFPGLWVDKYLSLIGRRDIPDQDEDDLEDHVDENSLMGAENTNIADKMMDLLKDPDLRELFQTYNRKYGWQQDDVVREVKVLREKDKERFFQAEQVEQRRRSGQLDKDKRAKEKGAKDKQRRDVKRGSSVPEIARHSLQNVSKRTSGLWNRILVWDCRATLRSNSVTRMYLPIIMGGMFLGLGAAYYQTDDLLLLLSALCLWTLASSLFMTPAIHFHLVKAFEIFKLEHDDGIGLTLDLVLQTFVRFLALAAVPIILDTLLLYLMITSPKNRSVSDILVLTGSYLQLNMAWSAFAILLLSINPAIGFKLAPLFSSLSGFVGGFLIPLPKMARWYRWLIYVNPNYFAYSAIMYHYLRHFKDNCKFESRLECYTSSGLYYLQRFGFDDTGPAINSLVLYIMAVVYLLLAWITLEIRYNHLRRKFTHKLRNIIRGRKHWDGGDDLPRLKEEERKPFVNFQEYLAGEGIRELEEICKRNGREWTTAKRKSFSIIIEDDRKSAKHQMLSVDVSHGRQSTLRTETSTMVTPVCAKWRFAAKLAASRENVKMLGSFQDGGTFTERAMRHAHIPFEKPKPGATKLLDLVMDAYKTQQPAEARTAADRRAEMANRKAYLKQIMRARVQKSRIKKD